MKINEKHPYKRTISLDIFPENVSIIFEVYNKNNIYKKFVPLEGRNRGAVC
tara:strand:- start:146 stop:298 length:153 start_codon:yes stop_codon:yes gene_type:complete